MPSVLDVFKASDAWSVYGLPLCPGMDNPWLYSAYALLAFKRHEQDPLDLAVWQMNAWRYYVLCQIESGLISRWPKDYPAYDPTDLTSHDELMGAAYQNRDVAAAILDYLDRHDGEYNNTAQAEAFPMQKNVYRMIFLRPYLLACAGGTPNPWSKLVWCAYMVFDALTRRKEDCGGALRCWLMTDVMDRFGSCWLVGRFWKWRASKVGQTPKTCLAVEPGSQKPIYSMIAPATW